MISIFYQLAFNRLKSQNLAAIPHYSLALFQSERLNLLLNHNFCKSNYRFFTEV